jgi:hypothetical protein
MAATGTNKRMTLAEMIVFLQANGLGSVSAASGVFPFQYQTSTAESITGSAIRGNNATFASSTKIWVAETTNDGLNVAVGFGRCKAGFQVYVQDYADASKFAIFNVTADSIDKGTYWELTVAPSSSGGTFTAGKVALQTLSAAQASKLFATTTTVPGLTPGANGATTAFLRGDATWVALGGLATATTLAAVNTAITDADVPAALNGLTGVWVGSQAQYDAIGTKVSTVAYLVTA